MSDKETGARAKLVEAEKAATVMPLSKFLKSVEKRGGLSKKDRLRIVDQALLLFEMNYVHLPLKRAMHAVDPIQRLKLLKFRLLETKENEMQSTAQFHKRMLEVFTSTRDLHTLYLLPAPFRDRVAFLPFLIEQYFQPDEKGARTEKFTVSRIADEFFQTIPSPGPEVNLFEPGVEVLYWNGVPIHRAIEINGETQAGSNLEARFARGLDNLTIRPLETSLPPDEAWVSLTYRARDGRELTVKQEWLVYMEGDTPLAAKSTRKKRAAIDLKKTKINQLKRKLYAPRDVRVRKGFEQIFYAEIRRVDGRDVGYIRLFSFDVDDPDQFVEEFKRVIISDGFPQEGLIIDVRGNGGGKIRAGERLLQLFTPRRIRPELFEFINTPLNLEICRLAPKGWNLGRWVESIAGAVATGATYSTGFPLNSEESCNDIGQVYYGPVVLITDALSYSTTDIFAAGFQDNEVGEILGTSDNTGAGGANVWWYEHLMNAMRNNPRSPFKPLPKGADLLVALRRSIRVGRHAGRPLEELGIAPDHRHYVTRRDVLKRNDDLVRRAVGILERKPIYSLSVETVKRTGDSRSVIVTARSKVRSGESIKNVKRLDVYLNGRPYRTFDSEDGSVRARLANLRSPAGKGELLAQAYDGANSLVAARRHLL